MSSKDRYNIFPSRMFVCLGFFSLSELFEMDDSRAQTTMKGRLKGAQTGHNLLKKKADALAIRFRSILKKIIDVRKVKEKQSKFPVEF